MLPQILIHQFGERPRSLFAKIMMEMLKTGCNSEAVAWSNTKWFRNKSELKVVHDLDSKLGKVLFDLHNEAHSLEDLFQLGFNEFFG